MKKIKAFFSTIMALACMATVGGCKDDAFQDVQEKADHDQTRYLNVALVSPSGAGTRATKDDFKDGEGNENYVNNMTFLFYDKSGEPTGDKYVFDENKNVDNDFKPDDKKDHVERFWQSTIPITLKQGQNLPAYVVCFINPITMDANIEKCNLSELEGVIRQAVVYTSGEGKDQKNLFPMVNSVYYGSYSTEADAAKERIFATPIKANLLYKSFSEAEEAKDKAIDIYVERYAARVTLNLKPTQEDGSSTISDNEDVNGYKLTFVPEYWRPNAIDQRIYAIKRFGVQTGTAPNLKTNYNPSYNDVLTSFNQKDWWNDADHNRSYWGCSPSYYEAQYPQVSDNITDVRGDNYHKVEGESKDGNNYPYQLHYFNYDQIANPNTATAATLQPSIPWDATTGFSKTFYARETTASHAAWSDAKNYNPMAVMASAVIVGRYKLTPTTEGATALDNNPTFYLYGKSENKWNIYFEDNDVTNAGTGGAKSILKAMIDAQDKVYLKKTNAQDQTVTYQKVGYNDNDGKAKGWFKVDHPVKAVRDINNTVVAGRLVALQLDLTKVEQGTTLYYYDTQTASYQPITETNVNNVNSSLLTGATGYASKYGEGLCYFSIPIEHLAMAEVEAVADKPYKDPTTGAYNFANCPAGAFGIVRNHSYTINVTKISGLATALRDGDQPIVPPVDEITYYISARVNILNWRIVHEQNVEL